MSVFWEKAMVKTQAPVSTTNFESSGRTWLTSDEAVKYLGLSSIKALYQCVRRGVVPAHRLGKRRLRFHRQELDQVLLRN